MSGQTAWCAALLEPDRDVPPGLVTWNGSDPVQRFAIYRNNVTVSLMEALAETFPATQAVAGEGRFRALARAFVRTHPPCSPVLTRYGRGFPVFMASSDLASRFPYLPDLARLELACLDALHAADAQPIDPDSLASALARPETLPSLRLTLHPSLATLYSPYAVVSLWAAHQEDGTAPAVDPLAPESAWVLRRGRSLRVLPMSAGDCRFVGALQDGATLGAAAETGASPDRGSDTGFDLTRCLAVLLREQLLTGIAFAEHLFPLLLLIGLGTRFSALALLGMTAVIQVLVYPDAWPVHGTWATILLYLAATGPGRLSVDHWIKRWALRSGPLGATVGGTVGGRDGAPVPWRS